ncbi:B1 bradykinin receptor-like [Polyodon spathula]|uniref:B1 bradykinin receptor-like n=1 Tax=Polyodon spathula TaxID=7913 RepID=UPI001B7E4721|nr:B1 bradykinin receptor-like [Polyodon spathula]
MSLPMAESLSQDIYDIINRTEKNNSSTECPYFPDFDFVYIFVPPYVFTICVAGLLGNMFVLLVFFLQKGRCTVAEIYLGNLAAADFMLLACLPFWAVNIMHHFKWPFGDFLCRTTCVTIIFNMYTSIYLLAMVSIDRYFALVRTMTTGRMRSVFYAKVFCLSIWLFGFIMGIPSVIYRSVQYVPDFDVVMCLLKFPQKSWKLALDIVLIIIGFLLPVSVIAFCNYHIIKALKESQEYAASKDRSDNKATKLIFAVILAFLLCWTPFHFFTFLDILYEVGALKGCTWETILDLGNQIATYLACLNSLLNPVLYVFASQYFRRKITDIFKCTKSRRGSDLVALQRSVISTQRQRIEIL